MNHGAGEDGTKPSRLGYDPEESVRVGVDDREVFQNVVA